MTNRIPKQWLCLGKTQILENIFDPIQNRPDGILKPFGGLWISPYTPNEEYMSPWHEWCEQEKFMTSDEGSIITLHNNLKVYIINSQIDLMSLIDEIGEYKPFPDFDIMWKTINFEEVAKRYDLIYLTQKGINQTRLPFQNHKFNLYTWDVSCGLMLNWCIKSQSPTKVRVLAGSD